MLSLVTGRRSSLLSCHRAAIITKVPLLASRWQCSSTFSSGGVYKHQAA
jgi:hypothetical protein